MIFYNEALSVVTEPAEAAELLERAGEAASIAAKPDEATEYLREAVRIHRERADEPSLARASASLARVLVLGYRIEEALEVLATAIAETPGVRDLPPGVALDALRARAHWLADDPSRALETADRVLAVAERLDLPQVVAEAMYVRGGALCDMGRTYEGIPVIEGAIRMAERLGIPHLALRARNALGAYLVLRQPAAALEVWEAGIAEAQRIGDRASLFRLTNNLVSGWIHTGQWTRGIAELELLISSPLPRTDRIFTLIGLEQVRAFTGKPVEADRRELEALVENEHDPNVTNMVAEVRAHGALATGRYGDAQQAAREAAAMSPLNAAAALSLGAHAAAWTRDRDALASFHDELLATGAHGGLIDARKQSIAAGLAALDGRTDEALPAFRTSIEEMRALSAALEEVLTTLDLVAVAGRERVDPALIQAARAKLESWEAVPFLERLDELMALQAPAAQTAEIRSVGQQVSG
jgi:tetratricopeptide (TPR) repeat protein